MNLHMILIFVYSCAWIHGRIYNIKQCQAWGFERIHNFKISWWRSRIYSTWTLVGLLDADWTWGLSFQKVTSLASISASSTDLKRIQTPYSLFRDFRADKTFAACWSGCRGQVWVQVWAHAGPLAQRLLKRTSKGFDTKSMAKLSGQHFRTA